MKGKYGSYEHDDNELQFSYVKRRIPAPSGRRMQDVIQIAITGVKQGSSASDLTTKLGALETAYATDGQDWTFYDNSNNPTVHSIESATTLNGVRVVEFKYLAGLPGQWGARTEYVNRRTYRIVLQAEVPNADSDLIFWSEGVAILASAGVDFVIQTALSGDPVYQQTAEATGQVFEQFGYAVGYLDYPTFPDPLWNIAYLKPRPYVLQSKNPLRWGVNYPTHFPIQWRYRFEGIGDLVASDPPYPTF